MEVEVFVGGEEEEDAELKLEVVVEEAVWRWGSWW